jgi:integrase
MLGQVAVPVWSSYIPLHPQLKEMLDDWIANHRPTGLRSDRLLLERNRPITALRVATALSRLSQEAGIGHVTARQLRHTLATQAINRGMSLPLVMPANNTMVAARPARSSSPAAVPYRKVAIRRVIRAEKKLRSPASAPRPLKLLL